MGDSGNKNKLAVVIVSTFILVVIGAALTVDLKNHGSGDGHGAFHQTISNKVVEALCMHTDFFFAPKALGL
ncbi:hypothetical protein SAY87_004605 [Trapa incisa]|uniref:Uncharacterized protein n=1 Tax=Trapa incisa TaxID=236973 RepID=A0AAN7JQ60_9MYRT|nr:hypothetical protein SAY87_004605 [Trapa incisa]